MKLKKSTIKFLQKNKFSKVKKPKKTHKNQLYALKDKDPKFYNYLQENDQELLNFSDDSDQDDLEGDDLHGLEDDLADSDLEDVEEDKEDDLEKLEDLEDDDMEDRIDQIEEIKSLAKKIQQGSNHKSLVKLAKAFKSVANMGEEEECLDWDENMINEIVSTTLDVVPEGLNVILNKENREKSKKWKKLAPVIKSFLTNLLKVMKNTTDSKVLVEIIKKSSGFITYYTSFPKLLKEFYKELLEFWSVGDERVRVAAFLVLRRCCLSCPSVFLEKVFKGALKAINQVSNFNSFSLTKLKFMNSCLVELSGLSLHNTYSFGFLGIRELALSLKNATSTSDYTVIHSWPFVNSIRLWADVIATYGNSPNGGENLKHLVYPLVQISIGALRLCPNSKNYPMHLIILQTLLNLSEKTGVFIPITPYLMEILSSSEITAKAKPSTLKPLDFSGLLVVPSGYMSTSVYQKGLFECVLDLFYDYFSIPSISFPELCIPISTFLKRWSKKSKNPYMNKNVRVLLEKIEEQSLWTDKERSRLNISPMDYKSMVRISSFNNRLNGARMWRDLPCRSIIKREDCIRQLINNKTLNLGQVCKL